MGDSGPPKELMKISTFTKKLLSPKKKIRAKRTNPVESSGLNLDLDVEFTPALRASNSLSRNTSLEKPRVDNGTAISPNNSLF